MMCQPMGTLSIVATPIGNLADVTLRALDTLRKTDILVCEDTRITRKLLSYYSIGRKELIALNDFNEASRTPYLLKQLLMGKNVALLSDAGTPLIADPGFKLVRACIGNNIQVVAIPGASSAISALIISGMPPDKFLFLGFPPKGQSKRTQLFKKIDQIKEILPVSVIIFESPYRLLQTLKEMLAILGNRQAAVVREQTKLHEEVIRSTLQELVDTFGKRPVKGEISIVI